MIVAHIAGAPVEETVVQFAGSGAVILTTLALLGRAKLARLRRWRLSTEERASERRLEGPKS
jgi:hypothetical protein